MIWEEHINTSAVTENISDDVVKKKRDEKQSTSFQNVWLCVMFPLDLRYFVVQLSNESVVQEKKNNKKKKE